MLFTRHGEAGVPSGDGFVVHDDFISTLLSDDEFAAPEQAAGKDAAVCVNDSFEGEEGTSHVQ
jgi:hypothetical protein